MFPAEFFEDEEGDAGRLPARVQRIVVPAIDAAVTIHDGPFSDLATTTSGAATRHGITQNISAIAR